MTTTLTGPTSFRASIRRNVCDRCYRKACWCEDRAVYTFDASDAVTKPAQRALFTEYAAAAKDNGYRNSRSPFPSSLPSFTAPAITASERHWLGVEVAFVTWADCTPLLFPTDHQWSRSGRRYGVVWSAAPGAKCWWVHVEGVGFYRVREENLLTGINY